jgi:myo-inositol-1(or 4)-monophosphatase
MNMELSQQTIPIELMKEWAVEAGEIALAHQKELVEHTKADHTPVTNVDYMVEKYLVDQVSEIFPRHQIIVEESGRIGPESEWLWAMDPIDGTKSFMRKLPVWAVSIGLLYRFRPVAGVIYLPVSQDLFWGWEGGAWWNDQSLVNQEPADYESDLQFLAVHSQAVLDNAIHYPRIQAYGSTAAHLALLAAGQAVGVLTRRVNIWDLAAGLAMLGQTGCAAEYLSGRELNLEELSDGRKTSEQMIATRREWVDRLRNDIHRRPQ